MMAAAALTLTACSNEEEGAGSIASRANEAISFRPAMGTRATETTNANLADFYSTAIVNDTTLFDQINFAKGSDNFYVSQHNYYWPGDNSEVQFYAYAPSQDAMGADVTLTNSRKVIENFSVAEEIADQVDLITANMTGTKSQYETSGVPLTFSHRLSQIEVRAKTDNQEYTYTVVGVRIGRAEYLGSFDFTTNKWTLDDWHDTAVYTSDYSTSGTPITLGSTPVSIMGASGNAMLLPQTLTPWSPTADPDNVAREAYLSVLIRIQSKAGAVVYPFPSDTQKDATGQKRQYAWASIPLSGTWEQGKKYVYTLDFTDGAGFVDPDDPNPGNPVLGDPIKATVNVLEWTEADNDLSMPLNAKK